MIKRESFVERRNKLIEQFNNGILLFMGNDDSPMNYADNVYHFRQDSTFMYYFGARRQGLNAIIDIDEGTSTLYGDDLTIDHIVWMGQQPTIAGEATSRGIERTGTRNDFLEKLQDAQTKGRDIHFLPPYRDAHKLNLFSWLGIHPHEQASKASISLIRAISEQRIVKSQEEIVEIERAVNTTVDMHLAGMRYARPGMTEAEVMAKVYEKALAANGNISFPIIATRNGQTLHNHFHGNIIREGDLFLQDAGAENDNFYAGDMTSTYPVSGTFTQKQKGIYELVLNAHEEALAMLKPGLNFKEAHLHAATVIAEGLKGLGLMKGNTQDAVANGAHALFFPHGLGHFMGLDVHDMENFGEENVGYLNEKKSTQFGLKSLRLGRVLQPGFVVTIEPGIYFIPELIDMWQANGTLKEYLNYDTINGYRDFGGARIEVDALITDEGNRTLGKRLAKTVEEVEEERAKAFE